MTTRYVEIAVEGPLRGTFNYAWGEPLGEVTPPGARVVVPFGKFRKTGYVLREVTEEEAAAAAGGRTLRDVAYVKDRGESLLAPGVLELARWISRHYLVGLCEVLSAALPSGVRKDARAAFPRSPPRRRGAGSRCGAAPGLRRAGCGGAPCSRRARRQATPERVASACRPK